MWPHEVESHLHFPENRLRRNGSDDKGKPVTAKAGEGKTKLEEYQSNHLFQMRDTLCSDDAFNRVERPSPEHVEYGRADSISRISTAESISKQTSLAHRTAHTDYVGGGSLTCAKENATQKLTSRRASAWIRCIKNNNFAVFHISSYDDLYLRQAMPRLMSLTRPQHRYASPLNGAQTQSD